MSYQNVQYKRKNGTPKKDADIVRVPVTEVERKRRPLSDHQLLKKVSSLDIDDLDPDEFQE